MDTPGSNLAQTTMEIHITNKFVVQRCKKAKAALSCTTNHSSVLSITVASVARATDTDPTGGPPRLGPHPLAPCRSSEPGPSIQPRQLAHLIVFLGICSLAFYSNFSIFNTP